MTPEELDQRVRREIGDPHQAFRDIQVSDGDTVEFNLSVEHVEPASLQIEVINGAQSTFLAQPGDYTCEYRMGQVQLTVSPPFGSTIIFSGECFAMMSNDELYQHMRDGVRWHCWNRSIPERYRSEQGFINYRVNPMTLQNLPPEEEPLLTMRTVVSILWSFANDASTDVDVHSAEGTEIDRGQRYRQLMQQIEAMTARYKEDSSVLNAGPYRWEVLTLRKISMRTGRLIPLYKAREYDDHSYPLRLIPAIDSRGEDQSGIPSQIGFGLGGYGA